MKLKPYPEYKDSGVSWLGQIPAHWVERRAKYYLKESDERSQTGNEEMLSVSHITGVTPRSQKNVTMFQAESNIGHKLCQPGDLVINTMWAWMSALGVSNHFGIVSPAYGVYRPKSGNDYDNYYLDKLLRVEEYRAEYICRSTGIRSSRLRLYPDKFLSMPVICPPPAEQKVIVQFLKAQDFLINKFIRNKRRLIELLKEQKQNIINQAVTRGLDPNVNLKPSGVEWIGDIPEHWQVRRLKFLCDIQTGGKDTVDRKESGKYPFFVRSQTVECIDSYSFDGEAVLTAGDGAGVAKVFHYMNGKFDYHQRVYKFSSFKNIDGKLFFHYFSNTLCFEAFRGTAKSTVDSLRLPMLQNFPVLLPPLHEQKNIVLHIEYEIAAIDQVIVRAEREIELIQEYRTRLISDVVTGQVDVRDIKVPEVTEEDLLTLEDNSEVVDDDLVQEEDE